LARWEVAGGVGALRILRSPLLEPEARKRVAAFPFVIADLRFKDAEPWEQASDGHLMTPADIADPAPYIGVPPKLFEDLALETLLSRVRPPARTLMSPKPCSL